MSMILSPESKEILKRPGTSVIYCLYGTYSYTIGLNSALQDEYHGALVQKMETTHQRRKMVDVTFTLKRENCPYVNNNGDAIPKYRKK